MGTDMRKPFASMPRVDAPESLRASVQTRVARARRNAFLLRMALSITTEIASVVAVVASFSYISQSLASSGLYDYARLVLSEGFGILGYSKEFGLTILESMPVFALVAVLAASLAFGWSTLRLVRQSRSVVSFA